MSYDLFVLIIRLAFHVLLRGLALWRSPPMASQPMKNRSCESVMTKSNLDPSYPHRGAGLIVPHAPLT